MVSRFEATEGTHVICGTTAQIYARRPAKKIFSDFKYVNKKIPPTSRIEGVDLVTEGIITLSRRDEPPRAGLPNSDDGAHPSP